MGIWSEYFYSGLMKPGVLTFLFLIHIQHIQGIGYSPVSVTMGYLDGGSGQGSHNKNSTNLHYAMI